MESKRFLIEMQYLGFRYHGVQKQLNYQSIQEKIEKKLKESFQEEFKSRFSSRTDAMVSANQTYLLLMFQNAQKLLHVEECLKNLPADMSVRKIQLVADDFTMLSHVREKEYHYYFSSSKTSHPFAAPFMTIINEELDIELMKKGAGLFEGTHHFENYSYKPKPLTVFERSIQKSEIVENTLLKASFFPEESFIFQVSSKGFMRGQVRLMMGTLFRLGKREMTLEQISDSLKRPNPHFVKWMAPGSGLILHKTILD